MTGPTRLRSLLLAAVAAASISLAFAAAGFAATPTYPKETQQEYESQLSKAEIESATFNKRIRSLHIKTKNGELFVYHYPKGTWQQLAATLRAHHITVTILTPTEAEKEAKAKPVHHKIRYIAGGILIVIVIVVVGVLLWNRRRVRD